MDTKITKNIRTDDERDFEFLRIEGQKHIESLSRKLWTDYNSHDPGVTILEALCYAITDLGNRIQLPVRDLLAEKHGESRGAGKDIDEGESTISPKKAVQPDVFPSAQKILTTAPVSIPDYRKLFIDIEGINNVFVREYSDLKIYSHCLQKSDASEDFPQGRLSYQSDVGPDYRTTDEFHLKGLYQILFEPDRSIQFLKDPERSEKVGELKEKISRVYHANRNLCEDLAEVREVEYHDILVCGDLEIESGADAEEVMAEFLFRIQKHLSPSVRRYSLSRLLETGKRVENVFDGPVLKNGFILDEELERANIRYELHLSDLIRIVQNTPGIKKIRKLRMHECPCNGSSENPSYDDDAGEIWTLCFPEEHDRIFRLNVSKAMGLTNLFKDVVPVHTDPESVQDKLDNRFSVHEDTLQLSCDDLYAERGVYRPVGTYSTIQNDLPDLYGTGENGLPLSLPPDRHAKALQLKGYLFFFDQVLATYFEHLEQTRLLISPELNGQTYFRNDIQNIRDLSRLIRDKDIFDEDTEEIFSELDRYEERKNIILDHLMARFAESMSEHAFMLLEDSEENLEEAVLEHKSLILKEYPEMSYRRFVATDYRCEECEPWDTLNVSGLEQRLSRLLGITDYSRRDLTTPGDEGMYLFEHLLFRPEPGDPDVDHKFMEICMDPDCTQCPPPDPYSLRLTIILPGMARRFSNLHFREFAENLIRREVPAHILTRICWIGYDEMARLEELYKSWLTHKMEEPENQHDNEYLKPLTDLLHELVTIYPEGRLHDCSESGESSSSIVLGKTTIGEIKKKNDE